VSGAAALQKLLTWLSPAFPVGAFAWSGGLETAIADGRVKDSPALRNWLEGLLTHGGLRTDSILLAHAHKFSDDGAKLYEISQLLLALSTARERRDETLTTGEAFAIAARAWPSDVYARLPAPCPYPIAVTAAVHSQVSVAVRLVPLGQTAGLQVMAALEPMVAALAREAESAGLDAIGGIAYAAEIAQMRHETLEPRLFRS
jgi:urease accessory protein